MALAEIIPKQAPHQGRRPDPVSHDLGNWRLGHALTVSGCNSGSRLGSSWGYAVGPCVGLGVGFTQGIARRVKVGSRRGCPPRLTARWGAGRRGGGGMVRMAGRGGMCKCLSTAAIDLANYSVFFPCRHVISTVPGSLARIFPSSPAFGAVAGGAASTDGAFKAEICWTPSLSSRLPKPRPTATFPAWVRSCLGFWCVCVFLVF